MKNQFIYVVLINDGIIIGIPIGIFSKRKLAIDYKNQFRKDQQKGMKVYRYKINPDYDLDTHGPFKQTV